MCSQAWSPIRRDLLHTIQGEGRVVKIVCPHQAHLYEKGIYLTDRYAVSFAGFMPRDDPAFVCVVVIRDPRTEEVDIGGGSVAAPVFQRIAARTAAYLNLTPTEPVEETLAAHEK